MTDDNFGKSNCGFKPGLSYCWHPCSCCIFPVLICAIALLLVEIYLIAKFYTLEFPHNVWMVAMIFVSPATTILLITLIQLSICLIFNELMSRTSVIIWSVNFICTLLSTVWNLTITLICPRICVFGDVESRNGTEAEVLNQNAISLVTDTQWIAITQLVFIFIVFHVYSYYFYQFRQELRIDLELAEEREQYFYDRLGREKVHPEPQKFNKDSVLKVDLFYMNF